MIDFSRPVYVKESMSYIQQAVEQNHLCGDGSFTRKCTEWMEEHTGTRNAIHILLDKPANLKDFFVRNILLFVPYCSEHL